MQLALLVSQSTLQLDMHGWAIPATSTIIIHRNSNLHKSKPSLTHRATGRVATNFVFVRRYRDYKVDGG